MVYFLYHTFSVSGRMRRAIARAEKQFSNAEIVRKMMSEIGDYPAFFASLQPEDEVVILGGDGTLFFFANAMRGVKLKNKVYACKAGTGNDFMRDVVGNRVRSGKVYRIDQLLENLPVAEAGGREYVYWNNLSCGMDGAICTVVEERKKASKRRQNYTLVAAELLLKYKPLDAEVIVDGTVHHLQNVWLATAMNGKYVGGGMKMAPRQDRTSDTVTLVIYHTGGRMRAFTIFPRIYGGSHVKCTKYVALFSGRDITVRYGEARDLQMDGEVVGSLREYRVRKGIPQRETAPAEAMQEIL